ncbi:hypothetical protein HanRHA438_Chr14g0660641 [Helianthus annuus]|nr:hypothetical protein HanRHA438_Chr14g0660641 [Helianthus annuus]
MIFGKKKVLKKTFVKPNYLNSHNSYKFSFYHHPIYILQRIFRYFCFQNIE